MGSFRRIFFAGLLACALALSLNAQYNALDFNYGKGTVAPLRLIGGPYASGAQTVIVSQGYTTSATGITFNPLSTNAPVIVGSGAAQETVTPSAVSCSTPAVYGSCTFTATFANAHGTGDLVQSGTAGLQEAVNYANSKSGGSVMLYPSWFQAGGTETIIRAATAYPLVTLQSEKVWTMQPTTLTSLAAPATLDATSVTWTGTTGTWTNAAHFLCVTYVDALGGEGPCSATYNVTPAANTILHIASPAASTGAVGWRAYAGATYNGAFLLPISSTSCTLTTLENVMPACAIGAAGTWTAIFVNTAILRPQAQSPVKNINTPFPQGHTTFGYRPQGSAPQYFQTNYGPFPAYGALAGGELAVVGSVQLPSAFLSTIGRTIRLSGKLSLGTVNTATLPKLEVLLGWVAGTTAGAPVAVCTFSGPAVGATVAYNMTFKCTMTTNATGAAGTIMPSGFATIQKTDGSAIGQSYVEQAVAAVTALSLSTQDTVYIRYTSGTNATDAPQLLDLHVEVLE